MSKYRVFTKKGCGTCMSVKATLRNSHVEFEEIDVGTPEGLAMAERLNITHAGTIIDMDEKIVPLKEAL